VLEICPNLDPLVSAIGPGSSEPFIVRLQTTLPSDVEKVQPLLEGIVILPAGLMKNVAEALAAATSSRHALSAAIKSLDRVIVSSLVEDGRSQVRDCARGKHL